MKRFVTLFIVALLFIMPSFGEDIHSVTVTAPKKMLPL